MGKNPRTKGLGVWVLVGGVLPGLRESTIVEGVGQSNNTELTVLFDGNTVQKRGLEGLKKHFLHMRSLFPCPEALNSLLHL